jgi:hypothetical protein
MKDQQVNGNAVDFCFPVIMSTIIAAIVDTVVPQKLSEPTQHTQKTNIHNHCNLCGMQGVAEVELLMWLQLPYE